MKNQEERPKAPFAFLHSPKLSERTKTIYESGIPPRKKVCACVCGNIPAAIKKREKPLFSFRLVSLLVTVAASAVFAVAGVADMNTIEFAVHSVLIELAIGNAAGNAAVDFSRHFRPSLIVIMGILRENILRELTKHVLLYKMDKKENHP